MGLNEQIKRYAIKDCICGKNHNIKIPEIIIENNAIEKLPKLVERYKAKKIFVLADVNTYAVAGEKICAVLEEQGITVKCFIFPDKSLKPDERAVGSAIMHFDSSSELLIGVGSGVINDIGKIVSATARLPYIIVGTAPSMDGYASASSSMDKDGLKVTLKSKCPDVIVGDIDILKNAPMNMLQSGLGDMLAKYVSIAEWRISHEITGEYYCERIAEMIRSALKKCIDNKKGLLERDAVAVSAVFEGLIIGGVAMALAGVSRPASGVEHYFSHVWDMRGLAFGANVNLHGIQCAVATNIVAGLYEKILNIRPNKEKALNYVKAFNYEKWSEELKAFIGVGADAMIASEKTEQKYNVEKHQKRIETIIGKWDRICEIIREEIPTQKEIGRILDAIDLPKTPTEIGIDCDLSMTLKTTKDIRDKYVLSRLLWDLGLIEEIRCSNNTLQY